MSTNSGFHSIIDYTVDGFDAQQELVAAFAEIQERWVRFYPGYRSARFHVSTDGTRVYTIIHWASEAEYRNFVETSDDEVRVEAIRTTLEGLSGTAEARMTGAPTHTLSSAKLARGRSALTPDRAPRSVTRAPTARTGALSENAYRRPGVGDPPTSP